MTDHPLEPQTSRSADAASSPDVVESVPWDDLLPTERSDRRMWVVVGAVAVLVMAIAASAARTLWPSGPVPSTAAVPAVEPPPASSIATVPSSEAGRDAPISEADLLAVPVESLERAAAAHAEWFLAELFTLDGSDRSGLVDLLPQGLDPVPPDDAARSFVESVTTLQVERVGSVRFQVTAVVRSLSAVGDAAYVRQRPRAWTVPVAIDEEGARVVDLPAPRSITIGRHETPSLEVIVEPPVVRAAAIRIASEAGVPDDSSLTAGVSDGRWRVSLMVRDEAGVRWPVVVWLDEDGEPVPPGW